MSNPNLATTDDLVEAINVITQDEPIELAGDQLRIVGAFFKDGRTYLRTQVKTHSPAAKADRWFDFDDCRIDRLNDLHPSAPGCLYRALAAVDDAELDAIRESRMRALQEELAEVAGAGDGFGSW